MDISISIGGAVKALIVKSSNRSTAYSIHPIALKHSMIILGINLHNRYENCSGAGKKLRILKLRTSFVHVSLSRRRRNLYLLGLRDDRRVRSALLSVCNVNQFEPGSIQVETAADQLYICAIKNWQMKNFWPLEPYEFIWSWTDHLLQLKLLY